MKQANFSQESGNKSDRHLFMWLIGRYERDEMTPSIEAARKIAKILGTTVSYLLGETEQEDLFKDPDMLKRLNEIEKMDKVTRSNKWLI